MHPELERNAKGADVVRLQNLLNKLGALLVTDGDFGPDTERAVGDAQAQAGQEPTGVADEALWHWLEAAPEPSADIPAEAVAFIVRHEISSRAHYERALQAPAHPGAESGVTIGIGYDLRFADPERFEREWGAVLPSETMARLRPWLGKKATDEAVAELAEVRVPLEPAWRVFCSTSMPRAIEKVRTAFPNLDALPPLCRGALVSLVFNRGSRLTDWPGKDTRREMAEIGRLLDSGRPDDLAAVPAQFESMKRLWPTLAGLRDRRDEEAAMFRRGLATG